MFKKHFRITENDHQLLKYRLYRVRYFGLSKELIKATPTLEVALDAVKKLVNEEETFSLRYEDITPS